MEEQLRRMRERDRSKRLAVTPEQREARLVRSRQYKRARGAELTVECQRPRDDQSREKTSTIKLCNLPQAIASLMSNVDLSQCT